ncbi:protein unc-93 A [Caerostris darwini]|uniref:Protein unc-93 A n=1 Tax=Caerostris darwini TaxID=1538125 RepID=A0AAV4XB27_9ARAC|nr:protein unc-93 A [Caerostris darwini]
MEIDGAKKEEFSKLRIIKNLILLSVSFLFIFTAFYGLTMLQSTMNKAEGIGVISQAAIFTVQGLASLSISSYVLKKLGPKVSLITGMANFVPYIAANFYPAWITMIPSAMLVGFGLTLLWGAHATYINECSKLYCELDKKDNTSKLSKGLMMPKSKFTNTEIPREIGKTNMQPSIEELSAHNLTRKMQDIRNKNTQEIIGDISEENGMTCSRKHDKLSINFVEEAPYYLENRKETGKYPRSTKTGNSHRDNVSQFSKNANDRIDERCFSQLDGNDFDNPKNQTSSSSIGNINAIFFGFHNLMLVSSLIPGNLLSFYSLRSDSEETLNNLHNCSCGADYCNTDSNCFSEEIEEVSNYARYLLTGICVALAGIAVLLNLFLDRLNEKKRTVTFSWSHAFTTVKFNTKKEQVLLIPLTQFSSMYQGFYMAAFTKSYIGCAWSTSHIGLVTAFYGLSAAVSSLFSGYVVKFVGRKCVFVVCQAVSIINLVFVLLWKPRFHQFLLFYLAGSLWGINAGVVVSQLKAFYGVLFQGEEETAFSSFSVHFASGFAIPYLYDKYLCTSVKLYILLAFSCVGLMGYLLAEREYQKRNKNSYFIN